MIAAMIAVQTLKRVDVIGTKTVNALQALSRRGAAVHIASGRSAGERCRPLTEPSAPRGICARVAASFAPGCLLPHVEPFNIPASAQIPTDTVPNVLRGVSPGGPTIPIASQRSTPAHLLAYARAEQGCCAIVPA